MKWTLCELGDVVTLKSGGTPSKSDPSLWGGDIPWVSTKELKSGRLYTTASRVTDKAIKNKRQLVKPGTVLVAVRGMVLAKTFPVSVAMRSMIFNQDIKAVIPKEGLLNSYLPYLLRGHHDELKALADEAAHGTKRIQSDRLLSFRVSLPPVSVQQSITNILCAYDDLIENNARRIAILEEIARRLYEEWFVNFRFPGHESVGFEETESGRIPEGWDKKTLGDILQFDKGVSYKGKFLSEKGKVLINLKNFDRNGGFRRDGLKFYTGDHRDRHVAFPGSLVVANTDLTQKGEVIGSPAIIPRSLPSNEIIVSHHVFSVRPKRDFQAAEGFLYYFLAHGGFKAFAQGSASGTTVLGLRKDTAEAFECYIPPAVLIESFEKKVRPILTMIEVMAEKNANLRAQCDLLLPKLISGEIDVSKMPVPVDKEVEVA